MRPGMTSARSSWRPTRTMAIRSYVPVTEKTSLTQSSAAISSAISGIRSTLVLMSTIAVITAVPLPRWPLLAPSL